MTKLLYVGDHGPTGFGTVAAGLLHTLHSTGAYEILQLGINYNDIEPAHVPWKLIPAGFYYPAGPNYYEQADPYGFNKIENYLKTFDPDVVFINNDFPIANQYMEDKQGNPTGFAKHRSKKILYAPIDAFPFPPVFGEIADKYDQVIAYSKFQVESMALLDKKFAKTPYVYHGVDTETYYPIPKEDAKRLLIETFLKKNKNAQIPNLLETYLVYFVGTNQWRKDIPTLFRSFVEFNKSVPNAFLIPHTSAHPMSFEHGGWYLTNLRDLTGLKNSILFQNASIFTTEEMNIFYNAADVLAYPTRGEGFGLPSIEAMATKTPVIATRFGPQIELHDDGRGYYIDIADYEVGNRAAYAYYAKPSANSLLSQLRYVWSNPEHAKETAERAYEWAIQNTWESKALQMHEIIQSCLQASKPRSRSKSKSKRRKKI